MGVLTTPSASNHTRLGRAAHDGHQSAGILQANNAVTGAKDEQCCGINAPGGGRIRMATSDGQLVVLGGWI